MDTWVRGYKWQELVETDDEGRHYYFERTISDDHDLLNDADAERDRGSGGDTGEKTAVDAVIEHLRSGEGENMLLRGSPGSGKSHICQRVATEWFDEHRYGEVFYRENTEDDPFEDTSELRSAIKRSDTDGVGDGHVLVVVEDAPRDGADRIFDVIDEFRDHIGEEVSFLLDSRRSEWERHAENSHYGWVEEDGSDTLHVFDVPEITEADCENAIETFNAMTEGEYRGSPESLYDTVSDDSSGGRGELLVLANELVRESDYEGDLPLSKDASEVHVGTNKTDGDGFLEFVDEGGSEAPLFYKLAVGIATLTAAEIQVQPALLYSLAEENSDYKHIKNLVDEGKVSPAGIDGELPVPLKGVFVFSDGDSGAYTTRHSLWGRAFLDAGLKNDTPKEELHHTFLHVIGRFASLADDDDKRKTIKKYLKRVGRSETPYLDRFEEDPGEVTENLLTRLYEFGEEDSYGRRGSTLVSLFEEPFLETPTPIPESVPDACSPRLPFELRLSYAKMVYNAEEQGFLTNPSDPPKELVNEIISDAEDELGSPECERIKIESYIELYERHGKSKYLREAVDIIEDVDVESFSTDFLIELFRDVSDAPWDDIEEVYHSAVGAAKQLDDPEEKARSLGLLADTAAENADWEEVAEAYEAGVEAAKEIDDPEEKAERLYYLARTAAGNADWEEVAEAYEAGVEAAKEIDDPEEKAWSLKNLADTAAGNADWEEATEAYEAGVEAAKEIDDPGELHALVRTAAGNADWEEATEAYEAGVEAAKEIEDPEEKAESLKNLAATAARNADWEEVEKVWDEVVDIINSEYGDQVPYISFTFQQVVESAVSNDETETAERWCDEIEQKYEKIGRDTSEIDEIREEYLG